MFHLDQQPTDSNPWTEQPSDQKHQEIPPTQPPNSHLTPLTDVPDEDEDEDDNREAAASRETDVPKPTAEQPTDIQPAPESQIKDTDAADDGQDRQLAADSEPVVANGTEPARIQPAPSAVPVPAAPEPSEPKQTPHPPSSAPPTPSRSVSPTKQPPPTPSNGLDSRVAALLDINAELLRMYMEFQTRNLQQSPECQAYSARLQSNLNWLAASLDKAGNPLPVLTLPALDAPPQVDFADPEKVQQLYSQLPTLFAKDVDRQQRQKLKRERAADDNGPNAAKRMDTGEHKVSSAPHSATSAPPNGVSQHSSPAPDRAQSAFRASQPPHDVSQTSQIGPSVPDLQRAAQAGSQLNQTQNSPPVPGPAGSPAHSDPSQVAQMHDMQHRPSPSPSHGYPQSQPQLNPAFAAQVARVLQDPGNQPVVKLLIAREPQFLSLPPNMQWQQFQMVHQALRRQQQQIQQQQQQGRIPGQPPFGSQQQSPVVPSGQGVPHPQGGSGFPNQISPGGGPTSYSNGMNGIGSNTMQPPASTSRPGSSHPSLMAQNMQHLTPQQRQQLMMMQQQQRMAMSTPQRPAHQGGPFPQQSPQHGSPQGPGFPDMSGEHQMGQGQPGVPGIAKNSRSPSVPMPSPVKGQGSFGAEAYPQAMMMSTGQHPPLQQNQSFQMPLQQGQPSPSQHPPPGWASNMNSVGMGMNPAAFQMNSNGTPGQPNMGGGHMFVNPGMMGGASGQQPPPGMAPSAGSWPQNQPYPNAGSPASSIHDPSSSRRASATPAPGGSHFDTNAYPQQWGS